MVSPGTVALRLKLEDIGVGEFCRVAVFSEQDPGSVSVSLGISGRSSYSGDPNSQPGL